MSRYTKYMRDIVKKESEEFLKNIPPRPASPKGQGCACNRCNCKDE